MNFEAVYYSGPTPASMESLTLLACVFDRVIFPGVYIPNEGVDVESTIREIERISALPRTDRTDDTHLINAMVLAVNAHHVGDFCVFTGRQGVMGVLEEGARELTHELETLIYGPPGEGFFPLINMGFAKALPGGEASVNGPSWLSYPANALLYANRTGSTLVNDNAHLPIPGINRPDIRANAHQLATVLALESVRLTLPNIRLVSFEELAEFRAESRDDVVPFRRAMLKLSKELNAAIESDATMADVRKEARFIVDTTIAPELDEMREVLSRPTRPWYRRIVDVAVAAPEIVGAFSTMPTGLATAAALAKVVGILADVRDAELEREGLGKRGGFHYLLRLDELRQV